LAIRVVLGHMSASLRESLGALIRTQPDMHVVADNSPPADVLDLVRARRADVIVMQDREQPEPLSSLIAAQALGVVVIDSGGRAGAFARITAQRSALPSMSGDGLIEAVRAARPGRN
jgi:chemotaxis response regulator CheB